MAAPAVRDALKREADKVENRGYADNGIQNYKDAAAEFMQRQFGVALDPVTEVCHCIGSKPAYAMLPACFINPGDVTLMTVPGYPVAGTWTRYLGGEVVRLPLLEAERLLPGPRRPFGRREAAGQAARAQLPEQPDRGRGDPRLLQARRSSSPASTRSWWCRTPRTSC